MVASISAPGPSDRAANLVLYAVYIYRGGHIRYIYYNPPHQHQHQPLLSLSLLRSLHSLLLLWRQLL